VHLDAHLGLVGLLAHPEEVEGAQRRVVAASLPAGHVAARVARGGGGAGGQRDGVVLRRLLRVRVRVGVRVGVRVRVRVRVRVGRRLQRLDGRARDLELQIGRVGLGEAPPQRGERGDLVVDPLVVGRLREERG